MVRTSNKVHLRLRISSICPSDTIWFEKFLEFFFKIRSNLKSKILQRSEGNTKFLEAKAK